jgi:ABC-2 type transport system permease protein
MRKVLVVALREYNAAVRTKTFVLGLVMMPILMGGSIALQWFFKDDRDTKTRVIAVVDRTPGAVLLSGLERSVRAYNDAGIDPETGKRTRGEIVLRPEHPPADDDEAEAQDLALKAKARRGEIRGWLVIGPDAARLAPPATEEEVEAATVTYKSRRATDRDMVELFRAMLHAEVLPMRSREAGLSPEKVKLVSRPILMSSRFDAAIFIPFGLMMLMFMLVLMSATPLMQGVVEEKMQRIAEVLLGSVQPFQLMLGKLIGMTGVSLTIAAVYLGGAYWGAFYYGYAEYASLGLLAWFITFQTLAALMFGALFIAVGAACTDMRETQNLLWPVMLLASLPMFFLAPLLRSPNSPVIVGMSFFPFATPSMMIARQAMPEGVPWWHPVVGAAGMLLTTLLCVWVAGRIFRVGILMMGKGASPAEMARWVFRG